MNKAIKVIHLAAGECLGIAAVTEKGAAWQVKSYPAGFTLLLHPEKGCVLFDTGYGSYCISAMKRWPGVLYGIVTPVRLNPQDTALRRLEQMGFEESDVRHIILSHLHADHMGGLRDFPSAKLFLDQRAYLPLKGLKGIKAVRKAFLPELLPSDFESRLSLLSFQPAPPELAPFTEYADVFTDGNVLAIPVPGHAAGMIALLVREKPEATLGGEGGDGWVLLAADAAWSVRGLLENRAVHPVAHFAFDDAELEKKSADMLRQWLILNPSTKVLVSHDKPREL